jgi:protease YdgD
MDRVQGLGARQIVANCYRWSARLCLLLVAAMHAGAVAGVPSWPALPGIAAHDPRVEVDPNQAPWRAIGRVQTELGGRCTGFLIGPRSVITAAHCLFLPRPRHFLQPHSIHFVTGYASGSYAAHSIVTGFTVAPGYDPEQEAHTGGADWAVLTLAAPLGGPGRTLRLAASLPAPGEAVILGGYSQDRAEIIEADLGCHVSGDAADADGRALLVHTCSATRGTSGAPLLIRLPTGEWAVAGVQIAALTGHGGGLAVPATAIKARGSAP